MKIRIAVACGVAALSGLTLAADLKSGVEPQYIEPSVRAADDFFMHANAKWIAATVIPPDKPSWSPLYILHEEAQERLRLIIEEVSASASAAPNTEARKVGDFYRSFMDEARIETLKMKPLAP